MPDAREPSPPAADDATRAAIAARLVAIREALLARIRTQLARAGGTRLDAEEVFSTTVRRTDILAAAGRIAGSIPDEDLLALATGIARRSAYEKSRRTRRESGRAARSREAAPVRDPQSSSGQEPGSLAVAKDDRVGRERAFGELLEEFAALSGSDRELGVGDALAAAASLVPDDLEVIGLRLRDAPWPVVAEAIVTTVAGAHRRYYRAIAALAEAARAREAAPRPPTP